ncbi:MAG: hypothetical protein ACYC91_14425 [Solirubrobacteraceae bacterium]
MDRAWLTRLRWRRRGQWMWPTFLALTLLDGVIGHLLPPAGESQNAFGAGLLGGVFNLLGIVLLSWPVASVLRRRRPDLPRIVARDYAGTAVLLAVSLVLLIAGVAHRSAITRDRQAMADAVSRAQAWIGDRAPAEFRSNLQSVDAYAIDPGSVYRVCVLNVSRLRTFCVVVRRGLPFAQSVTFAGYESNTLLFEGAQ